MAGKDFSRPGHMAVAVSLKVSLREVLEIGKIRGQHGNKHTVSGEATTMIYHIPECPQRQINNHHTMMGLRTFCCNDALPDSEIKDN